MLLGAARAGRPGRRRLARLTRRVAVSADQTRSLMVIGFRSAYCETAHLARQDARAYRRLWSSWMLRCSAQPSPRAAGRAIAGTRKFGVVLSMQRDRLGHGSSGDIADRYTTLTTR